MSINNSVKRVMMYWVKDADFFLLFFSLSFLICKMKRLNARVSKVPSGSHGNSNMLPVTQVFTI